MDPLSSLFTSLASCSRSDFQGTDTEWDMVRTSAAFVIGAGEEETLYGNSLEIEDCIAAKDAKKPYGDVQYADPGYQSDKKKRYPIDTEEHIRAAWNYIHKGGNSGKYSSDQVSKIKARIVSAWKRKIDKAGPPSA